MVVKFSRITFAFYTSLFHRRQISARICRPPERRAMNLHEARPPVRRRGGSAVKLAAAVSE